MTFYGAEVMAIWRPGVKAQEMLCIIKQLLNQILAFNPDACIIHLGHNDVRYHQTKNTEPEFYTSVLLTIKEIGTQIQALVPSVRIYYSEPFPRTTSWDLNNEEAVSYNRIARRMSRIARNSHSMMSLRVNHLWLNVTQAIADETYYDNGGLHLNQSGKWIVANKWVMTCNQTLPPI